MLSNDISPDAGQKEKKGLDFPHHLWSRRDRLMGLDTGVADAVLLTLERVGSG